MYFSMVLQKVKRVTLAFDPASASVTQNVNPIYNLLPDILSSLSADADLPPEQFQVPIFAACSALPVLPLV